MGIFSVWGQSFCCHSQNQRERAEVGTDPPSEGGRGGKQTPLDLKYIERRGRSDMSCRALKLFLTSLPEAKAQAVQTVLVLCPGGTWAGLAVPLPPYPPGGAAAWAASRRAPDTGGLQQGWSAFCGQKQAKFAMRNK